MPTWSVVWLAPVPRSRAGRSAVTARQADAGVRGFEHGRVKVGDGGAGGADRRRRDYRPSSGPSARKPADRSSILVCNLTRPAAATSYAANDSDALREPGATTISRTPTSTSAETTERASWERGHGE